MGIRTEQSTNYPTRRTQETESNEVISVGRLSPRGLLDEVSHELGFELGVERMCHMQEQDEMNG